MKVRVTVVRRALLAMICLVVAVTTVATTVAPTAAATNPANPTTNPATNPNGAFNLVVSPPSQAVETTPGVPANVEIKVQNLGIGTENIKATLMKFTARGQDGLPQLLDVGPNDESAKWVQISPAKFTAAPNNWQTVQVDINVPKTAAYGYYYAVVFSRDGAEQKVTPKQANLLGGAAGLVLLDVKAPGTKRIVHITEFSTPKKVTEFLASTFTVQMHNTGNTHVAARGNIVIYQGKKQVALLEVNLNKGYILPGTYRKFTAEWTDGTPVYKEKIVGGKAVLGKDGKPEKYLSYDNFNLGKLRIGRYTAKLNMVYNDGTRDVAETASLSFWVMPWRLLALAGLFLLFTAAGVWFLVVRPLKRSLSRRIGTRGRY